MRSATDLSGEGKLDPWEGKQREREHRNLVLEREVDSCLSIVRHAAAVVAGISGAKFVDYPRTEDVGLGQSRAAGVADPAASRADEAVEAAWIGAGRVGQRKPARERVGAAQPLIDLHIELIIVVRTRRDAQEVARLRVRPAEIRSGQ